MPEIFTQMCNLGHFCIHNKFFACIFNGREDYDYVYNKQNGTSVSLWKT